MSDETLASKDEATELSLGLLVDGVTDELESLVANKPLNITDVADVEASALVELIVPVEVEPELKSATLTLSNKVSEYVSADLLTDDSEDKDEVPAVDAPVASVEDWKL